MFCRTGYKRGLGRREDEDPSDGRDQGNNQEGPQDEDVLHQSYDKRIQNLREHQDEQQRV